MVTAGQARRLGVSRQDLSRLVADGTLAVAGSAARVYRLTGAPEDPDLDPLRAAWLQLGGAKSWHERIVVPDLVVSHRSAAHLPRVEAEAPGPVSDYDAAVSLASQIFDPVLDATAVGTWYPSVRAWIRY
jgi:hypothetical protein